MPFRVSTQGAVKVPVTITCTSGDPTGQTLQFAFTATTDTDPSDDLNTGEWDGSYDSTTSEANALSPTVGDSGTVVLTAGLYKWWFTYTLSGETVFEQGEGLIEVY